MEHHEQAAVLAISQITPATSPLTVALLKASDSAATLLSGGGAGYEQDFGTLADDLRRRVTPELLTWAHDLIATAAEHGAHLVTVLDPAYPQNLHDVHDQPPFLFYSGTLDERDRRAIAVVGTREASRAGLALARGLGRELAERQVTVVSGLARGIDTAAHEGALEGGGRTVAVFGTGIRTVYPAENRDLAIRISHSGACISQFWPDSPPTKKTFPIRNATTSGLALGTVVVEASGKSGASQQARHALRHGRQLFLVESLVTSEEWARKLADAPGAHVVRGVDDVLEVVEALVGDSDHSPVKALHLNLAS